MDDATVKKTSLEPKTFPDALGRETLVVFTGLQVSPAQHLQD